MWVPCPALADGKHVPRRCGIAIGHDARKLEDAGVKRVYTPKDFDLTRIVREIAEIVAAADDV